MFDYGGATPGAWAEHRSAIHFTGDTVSTWEMLDFQTRFTAAEGAGIGLPYVSHDIGGFHGDELPDDMYVRWIQSGLVQPILRLHSDHAPRLPWEYEGRAEEIAALFLRLRESFVPYLYTLAREAYDTGLPLARAMYLGWPRSGDAYRFDRQYMLGDQLLVAPVASARRPGAQAGLVPARRLGRPVHRRGPLRARAPRRSRSRSSRCRSSPAPARSCPARTTPTTTGRGRADPLILNVYAGDDGGFELYEDEGVGFGYRRASSRGRRCAGTRAPVVDAHDRAGRGRLPGRPGDARLQRPGARGRAAERGDDRRAGSATSATTPTRAC